MQLMVLVSILFSIFLAITAFAQQFEIGSSSGNETAAGLSVKHLGPAPDWAVKKASDYIKSILTEEYFNQYISYSNVSDAVEGCKPDGIECTITYGISFTYNIPHETYRIGIDVYMNSSGNIIDYNGPHKPYRFPITKEKAIETAKNAGLKEIIVAVIVRVDVPQEYMWAVSSRDIVQCAPEVTPLPKEYKELTPGCVYAGAYVNTETGEFVGYYTIDPLMLSPTSYPKPLTSLPKSVDQNLIFVVVIVVLIALGVFVYHTKSKRK